MCHDEKMARRRRIVNASSYKSPRFMACNVLVYIYIYIYLAQPTLALFSLLRVGTGSGTGELSSNSNLSNCVPFRKNTLRKYMYILLRTSAHPAPDVG